MLIIGYAYVWREGDLDWDKPAPRLPVYTKGVGVHEPQLHEEDIAV
jgi:hypothetical protein